MKRTHLAALAFVILVACDVPAAAPGSPAQSPAPASSALPSNTDTLPPIAAQPVHQGDAPGVCSSWTATPIDLEPIAPLATTASLRVRGDGRGGFTLRVTRTDQSRQYLTLTASGAPYGSVVEAPGDASAAFSSLDEATASSRGWVEEWGDDVSDNQISLCETDLNGRIVWETNPSPFSLGDLELSANPNGQIDYTVFAYPGAVAGRVTWDPSTPFENMYAISWPAWTTGDAAWHDRIFFALDGVALRTMDPAGNVLNIPTSAVGAVLGSTDPHHAVVVAGPIATATVPRPASSTVATVTFVGDDVLDQAWTLDAETDTLAAAARDSSHGALLAWTSKGLTAEGGVAFGFAEVAPGGVRGPIVSLGNQIVDAQTLSLDASGDAASYLLVETNVTIRQSFILRCRD